MRRPLDPKKENLSREAIIGLGESSVRKNYYSELQGKIIDLERVNARNRAILTTIPDIMLMSDLQGNLVPFTTQKNRNNPLMMTILRDEEIIRLLRDAILFVNENHKLKSVLFELDFEAQHYFMEARVNLSDSGEFLIIIRDITAPKVLENKLRALAERDTLTEIYNRRIFERELSKIDGTPARLASVLVCDIDGLKMLNDTLGHHVGDEALKIVAQLIHQHFGSTGTVARLSGDEFGAISVGLSEKEIETTVQALLKDLETLNQASETLKISISYGYAIQNEGLVNVESLYSVADNHMYQNKMFKSASVRSSLVKTLMKALQAKDFITEGHADRMEATALRLGEAIQLRRNELDRLMLLAKFHDIGKVGIPDNILKKPGKLDANEFAVMKTHTQIGKRIALESVDLSDIADLIMMHHERWDGTGYPLGISGTEIPVECRILSIVDTFDAMTNDRPYRAALSTEVALEEIMLNSGTQFDPELAELFVDLIHADEQLL